MAGFRTPPSGRSRQACGQYRQLPLPAPPSPARIEDHLISGNIIVAEGDCPACCTGGKFPRQHDIVRQYKRASGSIRRRHDRAGFFLHIASASEAPIATPRASRNGWPCRHRQSGCQHGGQDYSAPPVWSTPWPPTTAATGVQGFQAPPTGQQVRWPSTARHRQAAAGQDRPLRHGCGAIPKRRH